MKVYKNNQKINLTSLEFRILSLFFENINKVITRNHIIENIWKWTGNDVNDNTVTVYLKQIREKLDTVKIKIENNKLYTQVLSLIVVLVLVKRI